MNEQSAEIVVTCEAAVTRLTDPARGWTRDDFTRNEKWVEGAVDYRQASACLGGTLVLVSVGEQHNGYRSFGRVLDACPAVEAVAKTIKSLPIPEQGDAANVNPNADSDMRSVIFSFNDTPGRTAEQVVDVLNKTIKRHLDEEVTP